MRVIAMSTLEAFWKLYPNSERSLRSWYDEAGRTTWKMPSEIKAQYGNASILKNGRVVFNIAGNKYRLVVWINYACRVVYVRFIGTHAQYNRIDAQNI